MAPTRFDFLYALRFFIHTVLALLLVPELLSLVGGVHNIAEFLGNDFEYLFVRVFPACAVVSLSLLLAM
jgi:hypothetical protein